MSTNATNADETVRYCPECGLIGPVRPDAVTCCPDSFGMSIRRWQAEKMERILGRMRERTSLLAHQVVAASNYIDVLGGDSKKYRIAAAAMPTKEPA